ncbi:MAG: hypothetical protein JSV67_08180 [Thermoplasmatales archaeon]|nr:MAG: hypothetical protein JSV67_08180 [Thermoplasmatales archaeon]
MRGNKIIVGVVVMALLFSTMVILNKDSDSTVKAATPGVADNSVAWYLNWGSATTDIVYGVEYSQVKINTSTWSYSGSNYYLYYPTYYCNNSAGTPAWTFTWDGPFKVGGAFVNVDPTGGEDVLDTGGSAITFNRSGMWIFDNDTSHSGNTPSSYAGFIWVNTSQAYTISVSGATSFDYGATGDKTITVDTGTDTGCMIGIVGPDNSTIYHSWRNTGSKTLGIAGNFTMAGSYNISAYRDAPPIDGPDDDIATMYQYADENGNVYNNTYGSDYTGAFPQYPNTGGTGTENYNYTNTGPWDPPEKNATEVKLIVNTAEPTMTVKRTPSNTYWGYALDWHVNVTAPNGSGIPGGTLALHAAGNDSYIYNGTYGGIWFNETAPGTKAHYGNYSFNMSKYSSENPNWSAIENTTYYLVFYKDTNNDGMEEWNESYIFTIGAAPSTIRLEILDDGWGTKRNDLIIDIPTTSPGAAGPAEIVPIKFRVYGRTVAGSRAYYGDDSHEDRHNISVTGDILYPMNATSLAYDSANNWWYANVTPIKPGGTVSIECAWPGSNNGTVSQTLNVINGTRLSVGAESFVYGPHTNITITVTDMDGDPVKTATVYAFWRGGGAIKSYTGNNTERFGKDGEYTIWLKPSDQGNWAPRNITFAANWPGAGYWGYGSILMKRNNDLYVNCTPDSAYAGDMVQYDIDILVNGDTVPETYSDITVKLYNSTHEVVDTDDAWSKTGQYDINSEDIALAPGTYYLFAYNNTHDSEGHNATIVVTPYEVVTSPSALAWLIDTEQNITFSITPAVSGTLKVENVSSTPNGTWTGFTAGTIVPITDGVGTLIGFNSTDLGNITYDFRPEGGEEKEAVGLTQVTTAVCTPVPSTVYIGDLSTTVVITVTHPATGEPILEGTRIGLDHGIPLNQSKLDKLPDDEFTDADGKVQFDIKADASGNITIYVMNGSDPNNKYIIKAAARKTMVITTDPSADEEGTFVVEAKDASGALITDTTVSIVFNGQTYTTDTGTIELTAPSVPESLDYKIEGSAEGYTDDDVFIKIINQPKIYLGTPDKKVNVGEPFTITAGGDDGNSYGITITIKDANGNVVATGVTAGPTGIKFTINKKGDYTITATKEGYLPAEVSTITLQETPGFELLTLIIAIGVAFILLRRRRNK